MIAPFKYSSLPSRILFGSGTIQHLDEEVDFLGMRRAMIVTTPRQGELAGELQTALGDKGAALFAEAALHTPVEVTKDALAIVNAKAVDGVIAVGGGSPIGLAKALAYYTDMPQIVVPTTYAGSEMTPYLGQTEGGRKTTLRDIKVLPESVIYDIDLTMSLPPVISATSGLNALAHAVEALYAQDRSPIVTLIAEEAVRRTAGALPTVTDNPSSKDARSELLYGACLCGMTLASVGIALHHKLCHTLGGSFGLSHAETHSVILPYAIAFNEQAVPDLVAPVARILDAPSAGFGLKRFAERIGAPKSLRDIGMPEDGLERAADLAVQNPYWNPRPFSRDDMRKLLDDAWHGRSIQ